MLKSIIKLSNKMIKDMEDKYIIPKDKLKHLKKMFIYSCLIDLIKSKVFDTPIINLKDVPRKSWFIDKRGRGYELIRVNRHTASVKIYASTIDGKLEYINNDRLDLIINEKVRVIDKCYSELFNYYSTKYMNNFIAVSVKKGLSFYLYGADIYAQYVNQFRVDNDLNLDIPDHTPAYKNNPNISQN